MNGAKCPKCGSMSVESKHTMMERNFAMCYVNYCECTDCGNVWEPRGTVDLYIGDGYLKVPDGATLIVEFPDGEHWRKTIRRLDSHHFTLNNGNTWHVGQFRELIEDNPGTKVRFEDETAIASKDRKNSDRRFKPLIDLKRR